MLVDGPVRTNRWRGRGDGGRCPLRSDRARSKCARTTMKIAEFLSPQAVVADLSAQTKLGVLDELCRSLARSNPQLEPSRLVEVLQERERLPPPPPPPA